MELFRVKDLCSFESVRGKIVCNWSRRRGKILCTVWIPPNTIARLRLGEIDRESGSYEFEIREQSADGPLLFRENG